MKKKIVLLLVISLFAVGCGKVPKLSNGKDAVVTFANGDKISVDELYEKVKTTYALDSMVNLIDKYVLEKSFPKYAKEAKKLADEQLKQMRSGYSSDEELENLLRQLGFGSIESYKDNVFINYMKKHAETEYAKTLITDKEIQKYYDDEVLGDIEVSHILITAKDSTKEETAKKEAESILKTLKDTKQSDLEKTFTKLAKEKSQDDATKDKGGSLGRINKDTLDSTYTELTNAAYSIKDGELYDKLITTELGYHIIMRTKSYDKKSLKKLKSSIKETLASKKLEEDTSLSTEAIQHYRKKLGMEIQDKDLKNQYATYIQNQLFNSN